MADTPTIKIFQKGQRIISIDEPATVAYVIEEGSVDVSMNKDGKYLTLATLEKGAFFGEMALYLGGNYTANIDAASDNTKLQIITPEAFQEKLAGIDPLITKMLDNLIKRLKNTNAALLESETRDLIEIDLI